MSRLLATSICYSAAAAAAAAVAYGDSSQCVRPAWKAENV